MSDSRIQPTEKWVSIGTPNEFKTEDNNLQIQPLASQHWPQTPGVGINFMEIEEAMFRLSLLFIELLGASLVLHYFDSKEVKVMQAPFSC